MDHSGPSSSKPKKMGLNLEGVREGGSERQEEEQKEWTENDILDMAKADMASMLGLTVSTCRVLWRHIT